MQNFYSKWKNIFFQATRTDQVGLKFNNGVSLSLEPNSFTEVRFNSPKSNGIKPVSVLNAMRTGALMIPSDYKNEMYASVTALGKSLETLQVQFNSNEDCPNPKFLIDLPERETKNSILLYNSLMGYDKDEENGNTDLQRTHIGVPLYHLSRDLGSRWLSALYLLNPNNPNAACYFCSDVMEIIFRLIEKKASDEDVIKYYRHCIVDDNGKPLRRSKIGYLLSRKEIHFVSLENFIVNDIDDLLRMMEIICSNSKDGEGQSFGMPQLLKLKNRIEDAVSFMISLTD